MEEITPGPEAKTRGEGISQEEDDDQGDDSREEGGHFNPNWDEDCFPSIQDDAAVKKRAKK